MGKIQKPSSSSLHPNSRKASHRKRQLLRSLKISTQKSSVYSQKCIPLIDRLTWFQLYLSTYQNQETPCPTQEQIQESIKEYIDRNGKAIEELEAEQRSDRPIPRKLKELKELKRMEEEEFAKNGIELPTLHAKKAFDKFCGWSGDYNSLNQLEMSRYYYLRSPPVSRN
jgi:hypothetical protein